MKRVREQGATAKDVAHVEEQLREEWGRKSGGRTAEQKATRQRDCSVGVGGACQVWGRTGEIQILQSLHEHMIACIACMHVCSMSEYKYMLYVM